MINAIICLLLLFKKKKEEESCKHKKNLNAKIYFKYHFYLIIISTKSIKLEYYFDYLSRKIS